MSDSMRIVNRTVISTALPVEYLAVMAHLCNVQEVRHNAGTIYEVGEFTGQSGEWQVALVQTGQGNPRAALEVERAISFFKPSHVFFLGVAGGLKDVKLDDVVAVTKVYGYEYGKAEAEFKPRADFGESTYAMIQEATFVARRRDWLARVKLNDPSDMAGKTPRAFVGPVVAGEKVIASTSSSIYQFLKDNFSDALAVEMESFGFFRAVHANHAVQALVIRGISDMIDHKGEADTSGSQERASAHAAAFLFEVLARTKLAVASQPIYTADEKTPDEVIPWDDLETLAVQLYPYGPKQDEVWSRAGGDLSSLTLQLSGKGDWHAALRTLRFGGGGASIKPLTLIGTMLKDYPTNGGLKRLANVLGINSQHDPKEQSEQSNLLVSLPHEREQTIKILVLAANPKDTTPLRLDEEVREIGEGLRRARHREQFTVEQRWAVRVRDLRRAMLDTEPSVVHFSGHGNMEGLVLEDAAGLAQLVSNNALSSLFKLFANQVHCVVLNACYSATQAEAISQHIPYVIGMAKEIGDQAAIEFAVGFYDAFGAGRSVEDAYEFGCNAILLQGIPEHLTPVLHKGGSAPTSQLSATPPSERTSTKRPKLNAPDLGRVRVSSKKLIVGICEITYPQISGLKDAPVQARINNFLREQFISEQEKKYSDEDIVQITGTEGFLDNRDHGQEELPGNEAELWGEEKITYETKLNSRGVLSIKYEYYGDLGGAHPIHGYRAFTIDLATGYRYTFAELFKRDSESLIRINKLITYTLAEGNETPTDFMKQQEYEFYLTKTHLVLINIFGYEAARGTEAAIKIADIADLVNPDGPLQLLLKQSRA